MAEAGAKGQTVNDNPHFDSARSRKHAESMLTFSPLVPKRTEGYTLQSLAIYVHDYKHRELPVEERSLEAHYGSFVLTQSCPGKEEGRRLAEDVLYDQALREIQIAGCEARVYELGAEPEPDDINPRSPAVVVWHDGGLFLLVASDQLPSEALVEIAGSLY